MMQFNVQKPVKRYLGWKIFFLVALVISLILGVYFYYLSVEIRQRFDSRKWSIPARVFSATVPLYPGQWISIQQMKQMLDERRYQEAVHEPLNAGEYKVGKGALAVRFREFRFPGHSLTSQRVQFEFQQNKLAKIRGPDGDLSFLELEPLQIARLFGRERVSRSLINIQQVPRYLIDGTVAIEDHRFYEHGGVDWWGILRALWTDLLARRVVQGGSTITQQLVKNYFLEPERNLQRKLLEASMALIVDFCYSKDEILEMYMNEIYLGQRGTVAVHGMGEAARFYFGRNVEDLTLAEAATLAGMIRAPNNYSPTTHPEACVERRNVVLKRMLALRKISSDEHEKASQEPLRVARTFLPPNVAPYFVDYVRQQLRELYAPEVLESEGLSIYTTLHPELALAAESAVREGLEELGREFPQDDGASPQHPLQAALVAVQPRTGAVLALLGGNDYDENSVNRVFHSLRQAGTAIFPFVYLTALDRFTTVSALFDEPTSYMVDGEPWSPKNFDDRYRGQVTLRKAAEEGLNAATVNVAMEAGIQNVIATIRSFGISAQLQPRPWVALGAFGVTPFELAGAYAALGNDGQKAYLLSLKEVVAENGDIQERRNVDFISVTTPAKAYIITDLLRGALDRGAEKSMRRTGIDFQCGVEAGTSMGSTDSWFIGYTTDLLVLVWVGFDDGRPTHLSGLQGAGKIWVKFINQVRPWIHAQPFRIPPGVVQRIICCENGLLATTYCPDKKLEVFLAEQAPKDYCTKHKRE